MNMFHGTGIMLEENDQTMKGTLPARAAASFSLYNDPETLDETFNSTCSMKSAERDRYFQKQALHVWTSRPFRTAVYGFTKILHSFGFSFRDVRDIVLSAHFIFSVLLSCYLWKRNRFRGWCLMLWTAAGITCLQAFVFLPNQRFKTVLFDVPAFIVIILAAGSIWKNRKRKEQETDYIESKGDDREPVPKSSDVVIE
jgi:hypothetical protein